MGHKPNRGMVRNRRLSDNRQYQKLTPHPSADAVTNREKTMFDGRHNATTSKPPAGPCTARHVHH
jgi:hypothetical protein